MSKFVELNDGSFVFNADRVLNFRVNPHLYAEDGSPMVEARFTTNPHEEPLLLTWPEWREVRAAIGLDGQDNNNPKERKR